MNPCNVDQRMRHICSHLFESETLEKFMTPQASCGNVLSKRFQCSLRCVTPNERKLRGQFRAVTKKILWGLLQLVKKSKDVHSSTRSASLCEHENKKRVSFTTLQWPPQILWKKTSHVFSWLRSSYEISPTAIGTDPNKTPAELLAAPNKPPLAAA